MLLCIAIIMFIVAFASVPLYRLFCQVTGFGGTTKVIDDVNYQGEIIDRWITVRFNADTDPKLPWKFKPEQKSIKVRVGESSLVYYSVKNNSKEDIIGTAIYNVTPNKAGEYFVKQHCFCFEEQLIKAGQKIPLPVAFFIDPDIINDHNLDDVKTITLSYSFFREKEQN